MVATVTRPPAYDPVQPDKVDTSVQIVQSQVNVGEFGWTTNDMTSVKDIVRYVATAQKAAESADANAQYVQGQMDRLDSGLSEMESIHTETQTIHTNTQTIYENILKETSGAQTAIAAAQQLVTTADQKSQQAIDASNEVKKYALSALYSFKDWGLVNDTEFTMSPTNGTIQKIRLTHPTTDIVLLPFKTDPDATVRQLTLIVEQGTGSNLITFTKQSDGSNNVRWNNSRPPRLSYEADKADVITLLSYDKGINWLGFYNGGWFSMA